MEILHLIKEVLLSEEVRNCFRVIEGNGTFRVRFLASRCAKRIALALLSDAPHLGKIVKGCLRKVGKASEFLEEAMSSGFSGNRRQKVEVICRFLIFQEASQDCNKWRGHFTKERILKKVEAEHLRRR